MAAAHSVTNADTDGEHPSSSEGVMTTMQDRHDMLASRPVHAIHTDAVVVYNDDDNDDELSGAREADGPRRTMRKVSRRVLPLAAAAYGISGVRYHPPIVHVCRLCTCMSALRVTPILNTNVSGVCVLMFAYHFTRPFDRLRR